MANFHLDPEQLEYEKRNLFVLFNANNAFNENMAFIRPATFFICIQQLYLDPVFNCCYVNANRKECGHGNLLSLDAVKKFIKAVVKRNRLKKTDRLKEIADSIETVDDVIELEKKYPELFVVNDYRGKE